MRGNPGKRPLNKREPRPAKRAPNPLECLTAPALVHFGRLVEQLLAVKVVTVVDGPALSSLAQSIADYEQATEQLKLGKVVDSARGPVKSPWVAIQRQALDQMNRGFSDFGLTASARSKIVTAAQDVDPDEAHFFGA